MEPLTPEIACLLLGMPGHLARNEERVRWRWVAWFGRLLYISSPVPLDAGCEVQVSVRPRSNAEVRISAVTTNRPKTGSAADGTDEGSHRLCICRGRRDHSGLAATRREHRAETRRTSSSSLASYLLLVGHNQPQATAHLADRAKCEVRRALGVGRGAVRESNAQCVGLEYYSHNALRSPRRHLNSRGPCSSCPWAGYLASNGLATSRNRPTADNCQSNERVPRLCHTISSTPRH